MSFCHLHGQIVFDFVFDFVFDSGIGLLLQVSRFTMFSFYSLFSTYEGSWVVIIVSILSKLSQIKCCFDILLNNVSH